MALGCAAFLWLLLTSMIVFTFIGMYDLRRDDGLPPEKFGWWCLCTGAEWIVFGSVMVLAIFKLRRLGSRFRDAEHRGQSQKTA